MAAQITTNLQRLRIKQKEAIRVICNAGYRDPTKPLFKSQKILPLDEMIKFANLKFLHRYSTSITNCLYPSMKLGCSIEIEILIVY
jgi:hypothetical protein